jgi:hypothetical protein
MLSGPDCVNPASSVDSTNNNSSNQIFKSQNAHQYSNSGKATYQNSDSITVRKNTLIGHGGKNEVP